MTEVIDLNEKINNYEFLCPFCNNNLVISEGSDKFTTWLIPQSHKDGKHRVILYKEGQFTVDGRIKTVVYLAIDYIYFGKEYHIRIWNNFLSIAKYIDFDGNLLHYENVSQISFLYRGENILKEFSKQGIENVIDVLSAL